MQATIQGWGNSQGLRIPKSVLESAELSIGDRVDLVPSAESITIKKVVPRKHKTLTKRLEAFYGKPLAEIGCIDTEPEVDWGPPVGSEMW